MKTSDFDYDLPESRIAQEPASVRDACKLLVLDRRTGNIEDRVFRDIIEYLNPGDLLVANETRVMPARLLGHKAQTGGKAEVFLLRAKQDRGIPSNTSAVWEALVRPGKRLKPGTVVEFTDKSGSLALEAEILGRTDAAEKGECLVRISTQAYKSLDEALQRVGHTPLPPYIKNYQGDEELYQTVYASRESSAAAPTAGLHFTPELIQAIENKGVSFKTVELEVGLDTFRTVDEEDPRDHHMHTEYYSVGQDVVDAANDAHESGRRVIAVGTTSVRSLESAWCHEESLLKARQREATSLFLLPGSDFQVVDAMITNFHVPRSTLLMLVSAFATHSYITAAYQHALNSDYRFLSFGDAMLIH